MRQIDPATKVLLVALAIGALVLLMLVMWVRGGSRTHTTGLGRGLPVVTAVRATA